MRDGIDWEKIDESLLTMKKVLDSHDHLYLVPPYGGTKRETELMLCAHHYLKIINSNYQLLYKLKSEVQPL